MKYWKFKNKRTNYKDRLINEKLPSLLYLKYCRFYIDSFIFGHFILTPPWAYGFFLLIPLKHIYYTSLMLFLARVTSIISASGFYLSTFFHFFY